MKKKIWLVLLMIMFVSGCDYSNFSVKALSRNDLKSINQYTLFGKVTYFIDDKTNSQYTLVNELVNDYTKQEFGFSSKVMKVYKNTAVVKSLDHEDLKFTVNIDGPESYPYQEYFSSSSKVSINNSGIINYLFMEAYKDELTNLNNKLSQYASFRGLYLMPDKITDYFLETNFINVDLSIVDDNDEVELIEIFKTNLENLPIELLRNKFTEVYNKSMELKKTNSKNYDILALNFTAFGIQNEPGRYNLVDDLYTIIKTNCDNIPFNFVKFNIGTNMIGEIALIDIKYKNKSFVDKEVDNVKQEIGYGDF